MIKSKLFLAVGFIIVSLIGSNTYLYKMYQTSLKEVETLTMRNKLHLKMVEEVGSKVKACAHSAKTQAQHYEELLASKNSTIIELNAIHTTEPVVEIEKVIVKEKCELIVGEADENNSLFNVINNLSY